MVVRQLLGTDDAVAECQWCTAVEQKTLRFKTIGDGRKVAAAAFFALSCSQLSSLLRSCRAPSARQHSQVSLHKLLDEVDLVELVEAWGRNDVEDGDDVLVAAS